MKPLMKMTSLVGVGLILVMSTGCATLTVKTPSFASILPREPEPTQMVVTVQPSVLQEGGIPKHTGMMCRAYFFAGKDPVPVKVVADWTCIAYEAPDGTPEKPQGLYRVAAADLSTHYRKDVVGDSYVFWLPYETDRPAPLQVQGRLKLASGKEIQSSWIKIKLEPAQGTKGKAKEDVGTSTAKEPTPPANSTDRADED
jgi:hypothetical protein